MIDKNVLSRVTAELRAVSIASGKLAVISSSTNEQVEITSALDSVNEALEKAVVTSRNTLETLRPVIWAQNLRVPALPNIVISGTVRLIEYNWLHIRLNALLPNCRFQTPAYLSDTITRLLDDYTARGGKIPRLKNALLVIDEHCDISNRTVFDQDNKGWKAVSNALKSLCLPDDDQFSMGVALVSARSQEVSCHVFVIPLDTAGDFFNMRTSGSLYW